jgi:hypothetical protein
MVKDIAGPAEADSRTAEARTPAEADSRTAEARTPAEAANHADRPAREHRLRPRSQTHPPDPVEPGSAWRAAAQEVAARLVTGVVEVLDGRRPVAQLRGLLSEQVYAALQTRVRTARPTQPRRVHRVHTCHPAAGVVEASATFGTACRTHAVALRLEYRARRWRCTALRVL